MLEADEVYHKANGEALFTSHMLDLSEEDHAENVGICATYFKRMKPMNLILEMEIGVTGGVEDGVDNSGVSNDKLYTTSETVFSVHEALSPISEKFTIAAAFGNVHVVLKPELLVEYQKYAEEKTGTPNPLFLVFHGGSGSTQTEIDQAVQAGTIKMNVDTDTQWAYWEGLLKFYKEKEGYLQGQIGNPDGEDKPNKSYYDPRVWNRKCETSMMTRIQASNESLGNVNRCA